MFGGSCLLSPLGEVIAQAGSDGCEVIASALDLSSVATVRIQLSYLRDRRPECYHL